MSDGRRPAFDDRLVLAVETSCDDTCAAVVDGDGVVHSNVVSSQAVHDAYGGVVPEIAARHHLERIDAVVAAALRGAGADLADVSAVAVTRGPGLTGALLVGLQAAKAIALTRGLPLVAVDHLHGHVAACELAPLRFAPPYVTLVASGGHTFLARVQEDGRWRALGGTRDDAAGEAIDKGARLLGLPYPGGPALERLAAAGDPLSHDFPTARGVPGLDCSFSGLKTALLHRLRDLDPDAAAEGAAPASRLPEQVRADVAAAYQRAVVETLVPRVREALAHTGLRRLAIGGGVAANGALRERVGALDAEVAIPDRALCTDNAAMIAAAARRCAPLPPAEALACDAYASGERELVG